MVGEEWSVRGNNIVGSHHLEQFSGCKVNHSNLLYRSSYSLNDRDSNTRKINIFLLQTCVLVKLFRKCFNIKKLWDIYRKAYVKSLFITSLWHNWIYMLRALLCLN